MQIALQFAMKAELTQFGVANSPRVTLGCLPLGLLQADYRVSLRRHDSRELNRHVGVVIMDGVARFVGRTVLIADTQPIFRLGLVALLASAHPEWDVIETDTLEESGYRPQARSIDLLILASRLLAVELDRNGPQHICLNLARDVIAVTEPGDTISALGCLAAGAHATISRADPANQMLATIETIMNRRQPQIVPHQAMVTTEAAQAPNLTNRQLDVLRLLAKGQSNKVIARDLGLSVSTVKVHLNTVFRALGASNRVEAVVRARPLHARLAPQNH